MLNTHVKHWIEALRSGNYKQAQSALRRDDTYCCLGVACDLSVNEEIDWQYNQDRNEYRFMDAAILLPGVITDKLNLHGVGGQFDITDEWYDSLPDHIAKYIGKMLLNPVNCDYPKECSLDALNDAEVPFAIIADIIESEPPGMFRRG